MVERMNAREGCTCGYAVWFALYSPDGLRIATGSRDRTVRIWDAKTLKQQTLLEGHTQGVTRGVFSPDGDRLMTAGWRGLIRCWDIAAGEPIAVLQGHTSAVRAMAVTADGTLISAGQDRTVRFWNPTTHSELRQLPQQSLPVRALAVHPDGTLLAMCTCDLKSKESGELVLWDLATGEKLRTCEGSRTLGGTIAFSPNGETVAARAADAQIALWDVNTGRRKLEFRDSRSPSFIFALPSPC